MLGALAVSRRALGSAWPNPAVGCVLVKDDRIIGRGWTAPGGRPHAETVALDRAGTSAAGATAYVTLEPCAHFGQTPPCADALIAAEVARVVIAQGDPDSRVDGRGVDKLRAAGIEVEMGLCADLAADLLAGFLTRERTGRPLVTLKLATTLDGKIATRTGHSQWITGEPARASAHMLRARHDAILVGAGTARQDNPSLTCRLPGLEDRSPLRVVIDGKEALPKGSTLLENDDPATWVLVPEGRHAKRSKDYGDAMVRLISVGGRADDDVDLENALTVLGNEGITSILIEGGGRIAASLLAAKLVDRLVWYRAARIIGGDGLAGIGDLMVDTLDAACDFEKMAVRAVGDDIVESYRSA